MDNYERPDLISDNIRETPVINKIEYVTEEEPLYRLTPDAAQKIANQLGISVEDLKYLTRMNIGKPIPPTQAIKDYVTNDNHEIIANLPTISVDVEGTYIIPITLSDDIFELVKDKDVSEYKFYMLNDSDLGEKQMQPAFITGLMNTFELFSLSGEKMTKFGVKEFLMVGLLNAGKPFSFYLGKLLLALLMGGCKIAFVPSIVLIAIILKLKK